MLLSVIETAETLGCSAQYVRKLLREGRLAGQKIGDSWIINDDTLESFQFNDGSAATSSLEGSADEKK